MSEERPVPMLSAKRKAGGVEFTVWAPLKKKVALHVVHPRDEVVPMRKGEEGYFHVVVDDLPAGARYFFRPDGDTDYPDPASHYQPEGVHGPSQVVDHEAFPWSDSDWKGVPLEDMILYELHVGTFTPEGTFDAIIPRLADLKAVGINALELMPVAQFPGSRNWGYDGVYPYAVQDSYGGPDGLKRLVDAAHRQGIAVVLDVVYNHLGPEGNYLSAYAPYFTDTYKTPWGDALNFDGEWSDGVRNYFSGNALYWFELYHIDGLRCDAIHTVFDRGAVHFWALTHNRVRELEAHLGRPLHLFAESDLNSPKVVKHPEVGGYGFSGQWLDDFHHALYTLLDPKGRDRYIDFGRMDQLVKAYREGFVHSGEWVQFRKRRHGISSAGVPGQQFVAFNLNHDQVGNRVDGKRLCSLVDFEKLKVAAAAIMLAPYVPMLFMGEEYADESPFFYFVSHSDPELIKAVQKGRVEEFKDYGFDQAPPDPQDEKTFEACVLDWEKRNKGHNHLLLQWHTELIRLRRALPPLKSFDKNHLQAEPLGEEGFVLHREAAGVQALCLFNLSGKELAYTIPEAFKKGRKVLDSKDPHYIVHHHARGQSLPEEVTSGHVLHLPPESVAVYYSAPYSNQDTG
jgi:maltooligosyltrehalose trehalohydrolase